MRYIYFEIHSIYTEQDKWIPESRQIKNVNILQLQPDNLNSSGHCELRIITERNTEVQSNLYLDQIWVDLDVYDMEKSSGHYWVGDVRKAIELITMMKEANDKINRYD